MNAQTLGLIRHLLTSLGVILVALGVLTEDVFGQLAEAIMAVAGGLITIFSIVKSWNAPEKKAAVKNF